MADFITRGVARQVNTRDKYKTRMSNDCDPDIRIQQQKTDSTIWTNAELDNSWKGKLRKSSSASSIQRFTGHHVNQYETTMHDLNATVPDDSLNVISKSNIRVTSAVRTSSEISYHHSDRNIKDKTTLGMRSGERQICSQRVEASITLPKSVTLPVINKSQDKVHRQARLPNGSSAGGSDRVRESLTMNDSEQRIVSQDKTKHIAKIHTAEKRGERLACKDAKKYLKIVSRVIFG